MRRWLCASAALLIASIGHQAEASLILQTGLVGGSGDVDNVVFNTCGTSAGPAPTVQGCLNTNNAILVNFTSSENLIVPAGGQARVEGADGAFDDVTISLADPTLGFGKLQFNLDAAADGTATFRAVDQFGNVFDFGSFALDGSGENFFTLGSADNQVALSFSLLSTVPIENISELQQVRLGPAELQNVPEPGALALMGIGLVALGAYTRAKRRA